MLTTITVLPMEQITLVFDDNRRIIFISSPKKHVMARGNSNEYPQRVCGETNKIIPQVDQKEMCFRFQL